MIIPKCFCIFQDFNPRKDSDLPESNLWYCVIEQAYLDLLIIKKALILNTNPLEELTLLEARTAVSWVLSRSDNVGSFTWAVDVCINTPFRQAIIDKVTDIALYVKNGIDWI